MGRLRKFNKHKPKPKQHNKARKGQNKNLKFIQRGKNTENYHKKQKLLEDNYREKFQTETELNEVIEYDSASTEEDPCDVLSKPLVDCENLDDSNDFDDEKDSIHEYAEDHIELNEKVCKEVIDEDESMQYELSNSNKTKFLIKDGGFSKHLDTELSSEDVENILSPTGKNERLSTDWPSLGTLYIEVKLYSEDESEKNPINLIKEFYLSERKEPETLKTKDLEYIGIKQSIIQNLPNLSELQSEIFTIMNNYQDLYFPRRSFKNCEDLRLVYTLHALNHMLKTRSRIIHHNAKLNATDSISKSGIIPDSFRDQGLTRPKVLIILPYRDAAFRVVNMLLKLYQDAEKKTQKNSGNIINYDRFESEYTGNELKFPKTNPKPEDYEKTFSGNTDDNFRLGLTITKKCIKLYTNFYESDILIASPLGLRTIIGAQGNKDRDYDFLNSIEILIIDQAELIMAQNWENLLQVLEHMHLPPQSLHDTDFQRVRSWYLNGFARFYRQTLFFASHELPEFRAVFNNKCQNYEGKVRISNFIEKGDIRNVIVSIPQVFQNIEITSFDKLFEERFKYFIDEILPKFKSSASFAHCMIYIPSYFDFIRLRNYFKEETISCVQICEYTKKEKIARARDIFFHSGAHFLLYSERSHFFRRTRIKAIRHLIMYQLPQFPHFYSEMINLMHESNQNNRDGLNSSMSITVLYTKYDFLQLSAILGNEKATELLKSDKSVNVFTAE